MHGRRSKYYPDSWRTCIDLCNHLRFLIGCASNHKDNDILWFVPGASSPFDKGVLLFLQPSLDQVLQGCLKSWGMLSIDVLHPLNCPKAITCSGKY